MAGREAPHLGQAREMGIHKGRPSLCHTQRWAYTKSAKPDEEGAALPRATYCEALRLNGRARNFRHREDTLKGAPERISPDLVRS